MKIAIVGLGGVGGYMAGMLGRVYPNITLVARGKRKEVLKKRGLILHSDYQGSLVVRTPNVVSTDELEVQDYIFVCVKNYSLEQACEEIAHAVTKDTVIIPVMNGVDPGQRIRKILGRGTVVDSLIYIVAFANEDYSVTHQGDFAKLCIGIKDADAKEQKKVEEVSQILKAADIDYKIAEDIEVEIWRKYILNCAYNVMTAFYDNTIGQIRSDSVKAKEYEALIYEAYQVALSKDVGVKKEHIDAIIHRFYYELADDATSSLQRDLEKGKRTEVEVFGGYIVREAKKANIAVPVSERMYEGICSHCTV